MRPPPPPPRPATKNVSFQQTPTTTNMSWQQQQPQQQEGWQQQTYYNTDNNNRNAPPPPRPVPAPTYHQNNNDSYQRPQHTTIPAPSPAPLMATPDRQESSLLVRQHMSDDPFQLEEQQASYAQHHPVIADEDDTHKELLQPESTTTQQQQQPLPSPSPPPPLESTTTSIRTALHNPCNLLLSFRHLHILDLLSGLVCGILMSAFSAAFSSAIFDEVNLDQYIGVGYDIQTLGLVVSGTLHCMYADVGATMVSPDINPTVFFASMAQTIMSQSPINSTTGEALNPDAAMATILAAIVISTVGLGVIMFSLGTLGLTRVLQMLPSPVLAGFMASVGYTICDKALMLSLPPDVWRSGPFDTSSGVLDWWRLVCPALLFGFVLLLQMRTHLPGRVNAIIMPVLLLFPLGIFFIIILIVNAGKSDLLASARNEKWLIQTLVLAEPPSTQFQMIYGSPWLVNWSAVQSAVPTMFLLWIVTSVDALLKLAGIRRFLQASHMNVDHEMALVGKAVMLSGFLVGAPCYAQPTMTQINTSVSRDTRSRRASFIAIILNFAVYLSGFQIANYLPRFWLSGILFASGMNFLLENLWDSRHKMNRVEYAMIWFIVFINAITGLGWSILSGILMSGWIFALAYGRHGAVKRVLVGSTSHSSRFRSSGEKLRLEHLGKKILVLELQKFIFFGSAAWIREVLLSFATEQKKTLGRYSRARYYILDWAEVEDVDYTAVTVIIETLNDLQRLGDDDGDTTTTTTTSTQDYISVVFTGLSPALFKKLLDTDVIPKLYAMRWRASVLAGMDNTIPIPEQRTFLTLDLGLEWAEDRILERASVVRSRWGISIESFRTLHHQALVYAKNEEEENVFGSRLGGKVFPYQTVLKRNQGDIIHKMGDLDENTYVIQRGRVDSWNRDTRVAALGRGGMLNEIVMYDATHSCTTTAVVSSETAELFALSRTSMEKLESDNPAIAAELHRFFAKYASLSRERIEDSLRSMDYLELATGKKTNEQAGKTPYGESVIHASSLSSNAADEPSSPPRRCCSCCRHLCRTPIAFVRGSMMLAGLVKDDEEEGFSLLDSGAMKSSANVGATIAHLVRARGTKPGRVSLDEWCDRFDRLNKDVENDWYRLSRGESLITALDVVRILQVPKGIAEEMIWEADVDSTGGVSLLDLVEALATVASSEIVNM